MKKVIANFFIIIFLSSLSLFAAENYYDAKWNEIHFKPNIDKATNEDCLKCHQEIFDRKVRDTSIAGVKKTEALAWYQTLDTYKGEQDTFHNRHMKTEYAQKVMNLQCNTCHQGNDPREETVGSHATQQIAMSTGDYSDYTLRKMVNPDICLKCHGKFNAEVMASGGLTGDWPNVRDDFGNDCLSCHMAFRTNRHQVNYLKAESIEKVATEEGGDVCYGCHGGRAWYRISYPYPRHPWPGMSEETPEWAKSRPTESETRFLLK